MIVQLFLHHAATKLIASALAPARVLTSTTAVSFAAAIERERPDVAVIDPSVDSERDTTRVGAHPLVRALSPASAPPFVLYLSDGRGSLALRAALVRIGPAMVAARGVDDHPEHLRTIIQQATTSRVPDELLALASPYFDRLRPRVREAIESVVRAPLECGSVEVLARLAGLSTRALRRELTEAGVATPRDWLAMARVLRAHWELRDPNVRIRHLVSLMGYASVEPLAHDVATVTGRTPSQLRVLPSRDLLSMALRHVVFSCATDVAPHVADRSAAEFTAPAPIAATNATVDVAEFASLA